ncbi:uncharacterized protein FTOL_02558 [Fusarium torulosum]|uniref:Uncharacterized protein n=1 Tax=Fusarium torulosum TaxID=33205 RepID=A0AAE8M2A8_9HYPO|nr:uncharacterized protein FTOL_02558 [Fusarium torulosum]
MPHQIKTPSSQKPVTTKQATSSLIRNRQTGPYIRFKKSFDKPGTTSATHFDRTSSEEGAQRKMDLPRFTYSQKPMVNFSSNAVGPPKDAPKGPRADQFKLKSAPEQRGLIATSNSNLPVARPDNSLGAGSNHNANALAAAIKSQTIPEIARKTFGVTCKSKVTELCLSLKDEYLAMNLAPLHDQESFWTHLLDKLESNSVTQGKFKVWKESQPELDGLIDSWNEVFVQRFCKINRDYFESLVWSPLVKDEVSGMTQFEATRRDASQILDTEAVMSIITDFQPGLKSAISRCLNRNNSDNPARSREEEDNGSNLSHSRMASNPSELSKDTQSQGRNVTDLDNSKRVSFKVHLLTEDLKGKSQPLTEVATPVNRKVAKRTVLKQAMVFLQDHHLDMAETSLRESGSFPTLLHPISLLLATALPEIRLSEHQTLHLEMKQSDRV